MKKLSTTAFLILSFVFCLTLPPAAAAAGETVALQNTNIQVTLPDGWTVFNRPLDQNDRKFLYYDYDTVSELMNSDDIKCVAFNDAVSGIIFIDVENNEMSQAIFNLKESENYISDEDFIANSRAALQSYLMADSDQNDWINAYNIYNTNQLKFLTFDLTYEDSNSTQYAIAYCTYINGNAIQIDCYYDYPLDDHIRNICRGVIDSINCQTIEPTPGTVLANYKESLTYSFGLPPESLSAPYESDPANDLTTEEETPDSFYHTIIIVIIVLICILLLVLLICIIAAVRIKKKTKSAGSINQQTSNAEENNSNP